MEIKGKKYILTDETITFDGHTLYRIKAIRPFGDIKKDDLGGFIESENNLDQHGEAWVYKNGRVYEEARVSDYAIVGNMVKADWMIDDCTVVNGSARIIDNSRVLDGAKVSGFARIDGHAKIYEHASVAGTALIDDYAEVFGYATVRDQAEVRNDAKAYGDSRIGGHIRLYDKAVISGDVDIEGDAQIRGNADITSKNDYLMIQGLGSQYRTTTAYRDRNDGISVTCECFTGTLDKFVKKVTKTHKENRFAREYLKFVDLIKCHFGLADNDAAEDRYSLTDMPQISDVYYIVDWDLTSVVNDPRKKDDGPISRMVIFRSNPADYAAISAGMAFKTKEAADRNKYTVFKEIIGEEWGNE